MIAQSQLVSNVRIVSRAARTRSIAIVIIGTKAQTNDQAVSVHFNTANAAFHHTGGSITRIVVIVIPKSPFRIGHIARFNGDFVVELVLDKSTIISKAWSCIVIISGDGSFRRPLIIEFHLKEQIESR